MSILTMLSYFPSRKVSEKDGLEDDHVCWNRNLLLPSVALCIKQFSSFWEIICNFDIIEIVSQSFWPIHVAISQVPGIKYLFNKYFLSLQLVYSFGIFIEKHVLSTCRGIQHFGTSGPHWKKKSCLGPHIKYIVAHNHKKNPIMF